MYRKGIVTAVVASIALMATGCSKAPETEMQQAEQALQTAMGTDAAQYAPEAFRMAEDTLNAAKAAQAEQDNKMALLRSYGATKALYVSAKNLTDQAMAKAEQEKEQVKGQVATLLTEVKASLDSASAALAKAPTGKDNKAELALIKNDLTSITTVRDEAQADYDAGRYKAAQTKLETVMAKSQSIIGEIKAAAAKRRR